jgi:hypothetical protein
MCRLAAHQALAAALDDPSALDRRAWHLAAGASRPDEAIAAELERGAKRALRRAGYAVVAASYERAAELTPDQTRRIRRMAPPPGPPWRRAYWCGRKMSPLVPPLEPTTQPRWLT